MMSCITTRIREEHWWRTIDYLILQGRILNPDKFRFALRTVDFAGFRITEQSIEPLPKYLDAIRDFPTPTSITDIRSWFGLVNQVSHYAQLRDLVAPFRAPSTGTRNWTLPFSSQNEKSSLLFSKVLKYLTPRNERASALIGPNEASATFFCKRIVRVLMSYPIAAVMAGTSS